MFEKGEISKGKTISPIRANVKSFFTMAKNVKLTTVKIWKKYIRMRNSFLYKVHVTKKL